LSGNRPPRDSSTNEEKQLNASLKERVFLVFGAAGGIGSAVTRRLAGRGARLMLVGRREAPLATLAGETHAEYVMADAKDPDRLRAAVEETLNRHQRLDGVVNCYRTILLKPAHVTSAKEWEETLAVNLSSAFFITQAVVRAFPPEGGSVVLLGTAAARTGLPNHEAIAAAKAGLIGLALSAAATYAAKRIRFNVVSPGLVQTPLSEKITSNEASLKASIHMHPLGRIGQADEVASAVEWFLDPAQSWVTGQVLGVDGGLGSLKGRPGA